MRDRLFYDGQCPLCIREIRYLKNHQRGGLEFVDIHQVENFDAASSKLAMLRNLHLQTDQGCWLKGVSATVRAWSHTRWGWLFKPLIWPGVRRFAEKLYERWARQRYQRLYGCNQCMGGED